MSRTTPGQIRSILMFASAANVEELIRNFRIERPTTFRYSSFVPRLYNYVKSKGFKPGKILPSRAFCADESQGYPIIMLTKHFGTFPFNLGRGGAVVATDRHGPYAEHGEALVIIQASHVGYEPEDNAFGTYSRVHTSDNRHTACCGKLAGVIDWYLEQYRVAQADVLLERRGDQLCLRIDNGLLRGSRHEGLFLNMPRLVQPNADGSFTPIHTHSTAKSFVASAALQRELAHLEPELQDGRQMTMGELLTPDMFHYRRQLDATVLGHDHMENSLVYPMPWIVTSPWPALTAAQINTQVEFDRALRAFSHARSFRGKCVFHISGLNIDISPRPGEPFPTTKFVPWAAFLGDQNGKKRVMEQAEVVELLRAQSRENPDQIELDSAIRDMSEAESVEIKTPAVR
ncbi:MAG: hypothetical protein QNJ87_05000 [Gammaproteobacteria bacterium]|nr:hypothetical protein [Gammaproteobacteria bacterium]